MAKSSKSTKKPHSAPYSIRFSPEEREELNELTEGLQWSTYIKAVLFVERRKPARNVVAPIQDKERYAKLLASLGASRISQNINQLAKAVNSGSLPVSEEVEQRLIEACEAILWMRDTLIKGISMKAHLLAMMVLAMTATMNTQADKQPEVQIASILVNSINLVLPNQPRYLNITIIAGSDLGDSALNVTLDLPEDQQIPESVSFKLQRKKIRPNGNTYFDWVTLNAEDFLRQDDNSVTVSMNALEGLEVAEFSIGWVGAKPRQFAAKIALTDQGNNEAVKLWQGSSYSAKGEDKLATRPRMNCDMQNIFTDNMNNTCQQ